MQRRHQREVVILVVETRSHPRVSVRNGGALQQQRPEREEHDKA